MDTCGNPTIFNWSCLPTHFIENIVRMLLGQRKNGYIQPWKNRDTMVIPYIRDILSLRATCPHLIGVVDRTNLKLNFVLVIWLSFLNTVELNQVLKFMLENTNWKFATLYFDSVSVQSFSLQKYRNVYANFVMLDIGIPLKKKSCAMDGLFHWLPIKEVKLNLDFALEFHIAPEPNIFVESALVYQLYIDTVGDGTAWDQLPCSIRNTLMSFSNLSELELTSSFHLEDLELFHNLRESWTSKYALFPYRLCCFLPQFTRKS